MRKLIAACAACAIVASIVGVSVASATHYQGHHWYRSSGILTRTVEDWTGTPGSGNYQSNLSSKVSMWSNASSYVKLSYVRKSADQYQCASEPSPGSVLWFFVQDKILVCNGYYGAPARFSCGGTTQWAACTAWDTAPHHTALVTILNDSYMVGSRTASQQDAGAKSALCHELGHTFGLDHRYTGAANTCMDPFNYTNGQHQFYDLYDSNMLNQDIYVATDGSPSHNPGNTGCCDTGSRVRPGSGNLGLDATSLLVPAHAAFEDALPPVSG